MLFHTPQFLAFFLVLLPVYGLARKAGYGLPVLLLASQLFYAAWDWRFLILLWITILLDFFIARRMAHESSIRTKKMLLALSICASLSILAFFKYWNFIIGSLGLLLPGQAGGLQIVGLIIPVGVSFYTFQSMGYVIDVFRGHDEPVTDLMRYATFVCYFPHMVAGPIMRIGRLLPQLVTPAPFAVDGVLSGILLFSYGFLCKAVGDRLATLHDPVWQNLSGSAPNAVVFAIIGFGLQIYFDFRGYTEMARGISRILGVELMRNFRSPYAAASFRDFWRRWHISLSEWLRDYLYISLGGNRVRLPVQLRNLMITMLLGGLWHGAGWTFVIWGGLHGLYLCINTLWDRYVSPHTPQGASVVRLQSIVGWLITMIGVFYAWLYFRAPNFGSIVVAHQKIASWLSAPSMPPLAVEVVVIAGLLLLMDWLQRNSEDIFPAVVASPLRRAAAFGLAGGCCAAAGLALFASVPTQQQFIYFQF